MEPSSDNNCQYQQLVARLKRALNDVSEITNEIKKLNNMNTNKLTTFSRDVNGTMLTKLEINYN